MEWSSQKKIEQAYYANLDDEGLVHAATKPWSDGNCGVLLQEISPIFSLCPSPPARLIDIGCGGGWTSSLFAKRGYEVVGVDFSPDAIALAKTWHAQSNLEFLVRDFDASAGDLEEQFDIAVFYGSLHHATNERLPIQYAYEVLKPGGICIICEPGIGHAKAETSLAATAEFSVTERDMPPKLVIPIAKSVGFCEFKIYPHPQRFSVPVFRQRNESTKIKNRLMSIPLISALRSFYAATFELRRWGLVVLRK